MKLTLKRTIAAMLALVVAMSGAAEASAMSARSAAAAPHGSVADYRIIKDEPKSHKYDGDTIVYFERPIFEETTSGYRRINAFFEEESEDFFRSDSVNQVWETAEEWKGYDRDDFECYSDAEVTYQSDQLVCVKCFLMQYYGGMVIYGNEGYLFNARTGEQISLTEATRKSEGELKDLIDQAIERQHPEIYEEYYDVSHETIMESYPFEEVKFYVDSEGVVYVTFGKYAIASGADGMIDVRLDDAPLAIASGSSNAVSGHAPAKGTVIKDGGSEISYKVTRRGEELSVYKVGSNKISKAVIPSVITFDGFKYKVSSISGNAFRGCKELKSVIIGNNVTEIGENAFYRCTALTRVTIPSEVKKIGKRAFYGCKKLKDVNIKAYDLESKSVGSQAFLGIYKKAVIFTPYGQTEAYQKWLVKKGITKKMKIE